MSDQEHCVVSDVQCDGSPLYSQCCVPVVLISVTGGLCLYSQCCVPVVLIGVVVQVHLCTDSAD